MTDLVGVAAVIAAAGAFYTQWQQGRRLAKRDAVAAEERMSDRLEAKEERREAKKKLDEIGTKVDGAQTALINKIDNLQADKSALKSEVKRLNEPGAVSSNAAEGPVTTSAPTGTVNIVGEERRK